MEYPSKFWESRYEGQDYVYGTQPNRYFQQQLDAFKEPGRLLLLAEGEGRNAVYAAEKGWQVTAVDFSAKAREKALALAGERETHFQYLIADIQRFDFASCEPWDAIGLIYAHFPPEWRAETHQKCVAALRPGGKIILEAFNRKQLSRLSGGPKNMDLLYSKTMLEQDFEHLDPIESIEATVFLNEGEGHSGLGEVVRGCFQKRSLGKI